MASFPGHTHYLLLAIVWLVWCGLHSALIAPGMLAHVRRRAQAARYHRLLYNMIAVITLVPVVLLSFRLQTAPFWRWHGLARIGQVGLLLTALYLFVTGTRNYDLWQFLGIRNLQADDACQLISADCRLEKTGILGIIRHPWYAGGILIIWARDLDGSALITNVILTAYFIIGARLEERKLLLQFGDAYRAYRQNVSMLFPFKWLRTKLLRRS